MNPIPFTIIGSGWRAEYFLRIAKHLPERFQCVGMYARNPSRGAEITATWGVPAYQSLDELFGRTSGQFAVLSVRGSATALLLTELAGRNIPVLCETPPATDLNELKQVTDLTRSGARIQVAEQYAFQPMHAARLAVARSGLLGTISQAQVSYTQGYHAISLIRHYLGLKYEPVKITARRFESPIFKGPDRAGAPREEKIITAPQTLAWFEFPSKLGIYDFAQDQHRSYIRSDRILIRGERGEINQTTARYLLDYRTPMLFELHRFDAGIDNNMEGFSHQSITGNGQYWFTNPFPTARLSDDEIAVATCLEKMATYTQTGQDFYPLAEASHDQYLSLMMEQALTTGQTVEAHPQPWTK